jgi:hypothetical protein
MGPRTGLDDAKREILPLSGLELRPFGHPVRSQSLYRLRYRGSFPGYRTLQYYCVLERAAFLPSASVDQKHVPFVSLPWVWMISSSGMMFIASSLKVCQLRNISGRHINENVLASRLSTPVSFEIFTALKMKSVCHSETSVSTCKTARSYNTVSTKNRCTCFGGVEFR